MAADCSPVYMDIFWGRCPLSLREEPRHGFHGKGEFICNLTWTMSFSKEHFCPGNQIVKGRHGKKIRRNLFKFSFNYRATDETFAVMIEISATSTAPVFPMNAFCLSLVDRNGLHPKDTC